MAKNDFKAFATDRNANVISQEEWEVNRPGNPGD